MRCVVFSTDGAVKRKRKSWSKASATCLNRMDILETDAKHEKSRRVTRSRCPRDEGLEIPGSVAPLTDDRLRVVVLNASSVLEPETGWSIRLFFPFGVDSNDSFGLFLPARVLLLLAMHTQTVRTPVRKSGICHTGHDARVLFVLDLHPAQIQE